MGPKNEELFLPMKQTIGKLLKIEHKPKTSWSQNDTPPTAPILEDQPSKTWARGSRLFLYQNAPNDWCTADIVHQLRLEHWVSIQYTLEELTAGTQTW